MKPGDLAIIVGKRCMCKGDDHLGWIVTVGLPTPGYHCSGCGAETEEPSFWVLPPRGFSFVRPVWALRKVPPLGELDGQHAGDKLVEPLKTLAAKKRDGTEVAR